MGPASFQSVCVVVDGFPENGVGVGGGVGGVADADALVVDGEFGSASKKRLQQFLNSQLAFVTQVSPPQGSKPYKKVKESGNFTSKTVMVRAHGMVGDDLRTP